MPAFNLFFWESIVITWIELKKGANQLQTSLFHGEQNSTTISISLQITMIKNDNEQR